MPFSNHGTHKPFQPLAIFPILAVATALVLSFLCIFAGSKPGMMDDYAIFTLNTSRIGENLVEKFDNSILSFNTSGILSKRSEMDLQQIPIAAVATPSPTPTATITTPATLPAITMAPRDLDGFLSGLSSKAGAVESDVGGKASSLEAKATSAVGAAESAVASKVQSAIEAVKTAIVHEVNEAYVGFINELDLKGFYAVHLMTTCEGEYTYPNGTNYTISQASLMDGRNASATASGNLKEKPKVSECEGHSGLNPLGLVKALYWIGIVFVIIALAIGLWGAVRYSRKLAILNILATIPAVMFIALASAASHAFANGAAHLVNFVGKGIGISGVSGGKFLALTWAATALLLLNMLLWSALALLGEKVLFSKGHVGEKEGLPVGEEPGHEMGIRHPHLGVK